MVLSYNFLRFLKYGQNSITFLGIIMLFGIFLPGISRAVEREIDEGSKIKINVINFMYTIDTITEHQINASQEIERAIMFPAIEKVLRDFGVSNYSLRYEKVNSGNIDYSARNPEFSGFDERPEGLVIWGMVEPVKWPERYDLTLIYYMDSYPVYRASLSVRQSMITSWNRQKCQLPPQSLGMISGLIALKTESQRDNAGTKFDPGKVSAYIQSKNYSLPADLDDFLMKWQLHSESGDDSQEGMLTFILERGGNYKLRIDASYHLQLESFLTTNKSMNWFLDRGGVMMPEIKFNGTVSEEVTAGEGFRTPEPFRQTPQSVNIGIVPFENTSGDGEADWLGFGLEYLLTNKLSNIIKYKLIDREAVVKFFETDSATVNVDGQELSLDYSIGGQYYLDGDMIEVDISFAHAFSGVPIASEHYKIDYNEFFNAVDDAADRFIYLTDVYLTESEARGFEGRVTNSMKAFKYFCMGYIENSRSGADMDEVIHNFKAAIKEDPTFWGAYYNLGTAYYNLERYEDALSQFQFIIEKFPSFELAFLGRGLTLMKNKAFLKAHDDFMIYTDKRPFDYRGWYYAGRCAIQMKQYSRAVEYLSQAIDLQPMYSRGYYELGNVYYATNRYRLAIYNYNQTLKLEPDLIQARKRLGESYYRTHNFVQAFNQFKNILAVSPNDPEVNFMLGITVYKQAALDEYIDEFLELYGLLNPEEIKTNKIKNDGKKQRIYDQMITCFYRAQTARKNFYEATFNLALTYQEMGQPDSAIHYYTKTLQINPRLAKARIVLANFYENQNKYDQALEEYKQVVRIDPGYFLDYPKLGPEYDEVDVLAMVKSELEQEVRTDPGNISSSLSLANILYAQGMRSQAAGLYRKILSLQPEEKTAKNMLAKMEN